jgi:hypothetical protein
MELRLRETGARMERIHPLRNDFGSIAVIAPVLLRSPEAGSYSAAAAQCFSASPSLAHTSTRASARASASASLWQGLAVIRPTASSEVAGANTRAQTIVMVELQLGVRAAASAS